LMTEPEYVITYIITGRMDYDRAISGYSEVISLNPNYLDAYIVRGIVYFIVKRDYDRAISDFNKVIQLYDKAIQLYSNNWFCYYFCYYLRGRAYDEKGDYDKAIADYESALRINPDNSDARKALENLKRAEQEQ